MRLEELKSATPELINQLRGMGVNTVEALAIRSIGEVRERLEKVPKEKLKEVFEEAWRVAGFWIMPAKDMEEIRGKRLSFSTGSEALDKVLGGGIYSREITELAGGYGAGKSQLLFTVMVEALHNDKEISAAMVDSEDTYRPERVREIIQTRGYDADDILKRIIYVPITDSELFFEIIAGLDTTIETRNVKLILIDSIIAPLRAEFVGREVLWYRQQLLNKMLRRLLNLAKVYNLAVVTSNQIVTSPQAVYTYDPIQQQPPTGGTIMAHNSNTRLYVRKAEGNKRIARLIDSSWLPESEAVFRITEKGVEDVERD